ARAVEHQLDRLTYGSPHTPGCSRGVWVFISIDNFWTRAPSLRELLEEGLDTVSMRYARTRACLPRDAHHTGDGPAGSIKRDQETL
ncbi:hypothetical protein, partial [Bradyrhizobium jicamae]|uniref:hypothetical protein n=1 Tax=Bradyrhizobium jicamae TaxID=280332 RepID=UPI001AECFCA1